MIKKKIILRYNTRSPLSLMPPGSVRMSECHNLCFSFASAMQYIIAVISHFPTIALRKNGFENGRIIRPARITLVAVVVKVVVLRPVRITMVVVKLAMVAEVAWRRKGKVDDLQLPAGLTLCTRATSKRIE